MGRTPLLHGISGNTWKHWILLSGLRQISCQHIQYGGYHFTVRGHETFVTPKDFKLFPFA